MSYTYEITAEAGAVHAYNLGELLRFVADLANWEAVNPMAGVGLVQVHTITGKCKVVHIELRTEAGKHPRSWGLRADGEHEAFAFINEADTRTALQSRPGPRNLG